MATRHRERKEDLKRAVGHRTRAAREARGLSVAEVARRADLPRQYVYDLEGGLRVTVTNICGVARALGLTTDYLLGVDRPAGGSGEG